MSEEPEKSEESKISAKQWAQMISSYMSVLLLLAFLAAFVMTILVAAASTYLNAPGIIQIFSVTLDILSLLLQLGSVVIGVVFFACMMDISKNINLTGNEKSNWRWFLIINWIFAIPEYYESFLADPKNHKFLKLRKLLRPRMLMFFKP